MLSDNVIVVKSISKCYRIFESTRDRFLQIIYPKRRYFREFWALKNVSFEIKRGETVGVIGKNGSGKSTLLQLLCGVLESTSGHVEITGRVAALLELGSGFNPEFTGKENVYLYAAVLGLSKEKIESRFFEIVEFADIGDFIDQPVKTYSSGMVVRLAFSVIAHVDADILIIDEALSVGDAFFTQKCMRFLRKFMETGTVLFVSHDTSAVLSLCNRAIWIKEGKKIADGEPKKICQEYLKDLYEANQGESNLELIGAPKTHHLKLATEKKDFRLDYINQSKFRNDIEVFDFSIPTDNFGTGDARIQDVKLIHDNKAISWIVGGESVEIRILCETNVDLDKPIVGFILHDRLGQPIFADNTCRLCADQPKLIPAKQMFSVSFFFDMPILPVGDYTLTVALGNGTQQDHIQHHWVHDAILITSHTSSVSTGLVGIPMKNIEINFYGH